METSITVKRTYRSVEERRRIVEASLVAGAAVKDVARAHGIRPNQIFSWRKQYQEGRLGGAATFLPVRVKEFTSAVPGRADGPVVAGAIDVELPHARLRVAGQADTAALRVLLEWLRR